MLPPQAIADLREMTWVQAVHYWDDVEKEGKKRGILLETRRFLAQSDLFYLLVRMCKREDMLHDWIYARCREVEREPDGMLDLWSREHYKSTIITFGLTIQKILVHPDHSHGIFSHTRPIAKAFMRQIMRELEGNEMLHASFPDILWGKDTKQAPKWSEDDGIIVNRKSNQKESTIEAWGLVDGQPTSKHFDDLMYDDVVVKDTVTTPEMIQKTMTAWEESYNLGTVEGIKRAAGTRWHFNDPYATVLKRGTFKLRFHPGKEGGEESGKSVFWPETIHAQKRRDMGPYTYACQILLNPKGDAMQGFKREWIRNYKTTPTTGLTKYILVDAASSRKKGSDYTSIMVVGLGSDGCYYVLDMIRDRLKLSDRTARVFALHRKWKPLQVRYERYGMMGDIEHIQSEQDAQSYHFGVVEVAGRAGKADRIRRLMPLFEQAKIWLPQSLHVTDWEKNIRDLVHDFVEEEYMAFPNGGHDDMLDCLARIAEPDLPLSWPRDGNNIDFTKSAAMGIAA